MTVFTPDKQGVLEATTAIMGNYPTLADFRMAYGRNAVEAWLMIQLNDLSEYAGVKLKLTTMQLEETARTIIAEYYHLKLTEIMLFLRYCKCGKYGKFYGSVDPMVITSALPKFFKERNAIIDKAQGEAHQRQLDEWRNDPNNITYNEYLVFKRREELRRRYLPWFRAGYTWKAFFEYLHCLKRWQYGNEFCNTLHLLEYMTPEYYIQQP